VNLHEYARQEVAHIAPQLREAGHAPAEIAREIRSAFDQALEEELGETLTVDQMPPNDRRILHALELLEQEPGETFTTTTAAIAAESHVRPISIPISLYRLERDGLILKEAQRGKGTEIRFLRRAVP